MAQCRHGSWSWKRRVHISKLQTQRGKLKKSESSNSQRPYLGTQFFQKALPPKPPQTPPPTGELVLKCQRGRGTFDSNYTTLLMVFKNGNESFPDECPQSLGGTPMTESLLLLLFRKPRAPGQWISGEAWAGVWIQVWWLAPHLLTTFTVTRLSLWVEDTGGFVLCGPGLWIISEVYTTERVLFISV